MMKCDDNSTAFPSVNSAFRHAFFVFFLFFSCFAFFPFFRFWLGWSPPNIFRPTLVPVLHTSGLISWLTCTSVFRYTPRQIRVFFSVVPFKLMSNRLRFLKAANNFIIWSNLCRFFYVFVAEAIIYTIRMVTRPVNFQIDHRRWSM